MSWVWRGPSRARPGARRESSHDEDAILRCEESPIPDGSAGNRRLETVWPSGKCPYSGNPDETLFNEGSRGYRFARDIGHTFVRPAVVRTEGSSGGVAGSRHETGRQSSAASTA